MAASRRSNERVNSRAKSVAKRSKQDRSRISRACDFCKIKKRKCDGSESCENCRSNGATCTYETKRSRDVKHQLFRMRYLLDEGVQVLYRACLSREGFPGTTPSECEGKVSTLSILEHLGIMNSSVEDLDYERYLSASQLARQNRPSALIRSTVPETMASYVSPRSDPSDHTYMSSTVTSPARATIPTPVQPETADPSTANSLRSGDLSGRIPQTRPRPGRRSSTSPPSASASSPWRWSSQQTLENGYHERTLSPSTYTEHDSPLPLVLEQNDLLQLSPDFSALSPNQASDTRTSTVDDKSRALDKVNDLKTEPLLDPTRNTASNHYLRRQDPPTPPLTYLTSAKSSTLSNSSAASFQPGPPNDPMPKGGYMQWPSYWPSFFDLQSYQNPQFNDDMTMNQIQQLQLEQVQHHGAIPPHSHDPVQLQFDYADTRCRERLQ